MTKHDTTSSACILSQEKTPRVMPCVMSCQVEF